MPTPHIFVKGEIPSADIFNVLTQNPAAAITGGTLDGVDIGLNVPAIGLIVAGPIVSTLVTGVPPFVINSTTPVANLVASTVLRNADLMGDIVSDGNHTAITPTGVTAGSYGAAATSAILTVNTKGQVTNATSALINVPASQITGLGTMATQNANAVLITGGNATLGAITATTSLTVQGLAIGTGALSDTTNIGVGIGTLAALTTGSNNIALGQYANNDTTTGVANIAIGTNSLAFNTIGGSNIAIGNSALLSNTTASNNLAIGIAAMQVSTTASGNVSIGNLSLRGLVTGTNNTAIGYSALTLNTSGGNTAVGQVSLTTNTTGTANTAVGQGSLQTNSTGSYLVATGQGSLQNNTTGSNNVSVGQNAMYASTSGGNNVAIGQNAGVTGTLANSNTTGSGNTWVGYQAGSGTPTQLFNSMGLGNGAINLTSNDISLGNASIVTVRTTGSIKTGVFTVATLPSYTLAGIGARAFVTDATLTLAAALGAVAIGGGTNKVPVYSDGASWLIG